MINAIVLLCAAGLIAIDQILKAWMLELLSSGPIMLIPGLLQLTYVENRGAAFGIFQGRVQILSVITSVVLIVVVVLLLMGKFKHMVELWSIGLIIAGGAGNLIDRIARGYVIDYLDISPLFSFPVFNFADCCVVVGTCLLAFYLIALDGKEPKKSGGEAAAGEIGITDGDVAGVSMADLDAGEMGAASHGANGVEAGEMNAASHGANGVEAGETNAASHGANGVEAGKMNAASHGANGVEAGEMGTASHGANGIEAGEMGADASRDFCGGAAKTDE